MLYNMCHFMLYNMSHVMLYKICHVKLYNMCHVMLYNFETPWTVIRWLNENELIWNGRDVGKSHIVSCQFEIQAIVDCLKKSR